MAQDPLTPFGTKVEETVTGGDDGRAIAPWVSTTPSRTTTTRMPNTGGSTPLGTSSTEKDKEKEKEKDTGTGQELLQKLALVKQKLAAKGIEDTEVLSSLMAVEGMAQGPQAQKLTHKVVTQLQKAEKSKEALKEEIHALDKRWKEWHEYMTKKHQEQKTMFLEKRETLLTKYAEVRTKITDLKTEIKSVAESMAETKEENDDFLEVDGIGDPFSGQVDLTGVLDEEAEMIPDGDDKRKLPTQLVQGSPLKQRKV